MNMSLSSAWTFRFCLGGESQIETREKRKFVELPKAAISPRGSSPLTCCQWLAALKSTSLLDGLF